MSKQIQNTNQNSGNVLARRKRVKRIKNMMIITAVALILIPIILCIGLMIKVQKLENQIQTIAALYSQEYENLTEAGEDPGGSGVVYAAETQADDPEDTLTDDLMTEPEVTEDGEEPDKNIEDELVLTPEEQIDIEQDSKKVYLTFDDGPGQYTDALLDVLKKNNVKATFFVIGKTDAHSLDMYRRIVAEGHTLGMHSYSHQYAKIYKSVKAFDKDFNKLSDLLYEVTGERPTIYRFPGGSSNLVSECPMTDFITYLNDKEITYFDWNAINGDATGKNLTAKQMIKSVMSSVKENNNSIVLMHDTVSKDTTLNSMQKLIDELETEGYTILPITKYTKTVQHVKADSVEE